MFYNVEARSYLAWSLKPETIKNNKISEMGDSIDNPESMYYSNFFGKNKLPIIFYVHPGDASRIFPRCKS